VALVCVGSARGAPGATTLALLMAGLWPRRAVVVELDAAGGVVAARYGLGRSPGLSDLAAAVGNHAAPAAVWQCAQELPGGLPVVVAPESGDVAVAMLRDVAAGLGPWFHRIEDADVVADCGRVSGDSPVFGMLADADSMLLVARPEADELYAAAHRLHALPPRRRVSRVGLVLVGESPYSRREVEEQLGVQVLGVAEDDARTASLLRRGGAARALRRSLLVRSVQSLVDDLADRLEITPAPEGVSAGGDVLSSRGGGDL
jgi:MinD-like ATPase involved in chromosome partitioning or flagellar assembly